MAFNFIPINSGEKGAEVAANILTNFNTLATAVTELQTKIQTLESQIDVFNGTVITESSPISVSVNPSILYVKSANIDTVFNVYVKVMKGDTELEFDTDNSVDKFGVEITTPQILSNGNIICTVSSSNDNGMLVLNVSSKAGADNDSIIEFTISFKGETYSQTIPLIIARTEASDGVGMFVSTIFIRDDTETGPSTPYGGTYESPLPSGENHQGWSDGIPEGSGALWCSHRKFSSDGSSDDSAWSTPIKAFDNGDVDVAYSSYSGTPESGPGNTHPTQGSGYAPYYWHDTGTTDDIWMAISFKTAGEWGEWKISRIKGETGRAVFTSYVFTRSETTVTDQPLASYGTFEQPNPTDDNLFYGSDGTAWYDGVPAGTSAVYSSHRIFTNDGKSPQEAAWSTPILLTDTDSMDVCYHRETEDGSQPKAPSNTSHPTQGNDLTTWHDSGDTLDYWMAIAIKQNGVWNDWQIMQIKGEQGKQGEPGTSGLVVYFDPNPIAATETDASVGMPTGTTYARLILCDNGIEIPSNRSGFNVEIVESESTNIDEIEYTLEERDNSNISTIRSYSGSSYYFWISNFQKKGKAYSSVTGNAKFKIEYNGDTYYRSCAWMCNWLGTFRETISADTDTRISEKLGSFIDDNGLITATSAQSMIEQSASAITLQVAALSGNVEGLSGSVSSISQKADTISGSVSNLDGRLTTLSATCDGLTATVGDLSESASTISQRIDGIDIGVKDGDTIGGLYIASTGSTFTGPVTATQFNVQTNAGGTIESVPDDISMIITTWGNATSIASGTNTTLSSLETSTPVFLIRNGSSFFVLNPLLLASEGSNPIYAKWIAVTMNLLSAGSTTSDITIPKTISTNKFKNYSTFQKWYQGYKTVNGTKYYTTATGGEGSVEWVTTSYTQDKRVFADKDFDMENTITDGVYVNGSESQIEAYEGQIIIHPFNAMQYVDGELVQTWVIYMSYPSTGGSLYTLCDKNGKNMSSMTLYDYLIDTDQITDSGGGVLPRE